MKITKQTKMSMRSSPNDSLNSQFNYLRLHSEREFNNGSGDEYCVWMD